MDRRIAHPDVGTPIRTWWKGHYTHVFLALYPFFRIRSEGSTGAQTGQYDPVFDWDERPDDFDEILKLRGEAISWAEVHKTLAPDVSKREFYVAVWVSATFGYAKRANFALQEKIAAFCEAENIYLPEDDFIPAILHPVIGSFLAPFEGQKIVAYDEVRLKSLELSLSSFRPEAPAAFIPEATTTDGLWAIHLPEPGILMTSSYDGTEVLIAMTDAAFMQSDPREYFETEPVDEGMYSDWLNPVDFFERNG